MYKKHYVMDSKQIQIYSKEIKSEDVFKLKKDKC